MAHKARPKKSTKVGSSPPPQASASATKQKVLTVAALADKVRRPVRPDKKRHKKIKQGNAFGKEDLANWRNGAGRAKSWKLAKPGRIQSHHSNCDDFRAAGDAEFLIDMVLAGVTVTQVLRPVLPLALLIAGVSRSEAQLVHVRSVTPKSSGGRAHKLQAAMIDSDWRLTMRRRWFPPTPSPTAERFIFTQKVGHTFLGGWLFEEYVVRDLQWHYSHLVGFTLHKVHLTDLDDVCHDDLGITHIAHRSFVVGGSWRLAVVGKKLEEPSIFARYLSGTMTARVRRYFEDFPKPGFTGGGEQPEEQLVSDFVAGLDVSAAQKKKKTRMVKQRMKRREKRAEASAATRLLISATSQGSDTVTPSPAVSHKKCRNESRETCFSAASRSSATDSCLFSSSSSTS
ncbi:hypothetical protein V8F06_014166 [Rhypophila decipiens]